MWWENNLKLKEFFLSKGYNIDLFLENRKQYFNFTSWYNGYVESFHKYYVFNGEKKVYKNRFYLGFPKVISETFANLICNENVEITINSGEEQNAVLRKFLDRSNFRTRLNLAVEKAFALGFVAIVIYVDQLGPNVHFVTCDNIIPLTFDHNDIYECAFMSDSQDLNGNLIRSIQLHTKNKNDEYVISNFKFYVDPNGGLTPCEFNDIPKTINTLSTHPWFSIIKPNVVNNLDINSPFGIPIYANSLHTIKTLDIIYDSFVNEIQNGRKRLFVTSDALKVNSKGCLSNAFDPNDVVFYLLDSNISQDGKTNGKYVQEVNGELRVDELRTALRTNLELLSLQLGLGKGFFQFDTDNGYIKTATEVVSSNSDLYRTIHKHEILIENALIKIFKTIQFIYSSELNINIDGDITIDFDDSVIESDAAKREEDRKDVQMGVMSLAEYRSKWYDEPFEYAAKQISYAQSERLESR